MKQHHNQPEAGFAMVEALLVLIIVALIAGVGYWVWHQRAQMTNQASDTPTAGVQLPTVTNVTKTASFATFLEQTATAENQLADQTATNLTSSALSANTAAKSIGDAYNDSTL